MLSDEAAHHLERACWNLESLNSIQDLTKILAEAHVA
jgi:hypothetical protein